MIHLNLTGRLRARKSYHTHGQRTETVVVAPDEFQSQWIVFGDVQAFVMVQAVIGADGALCMAYTF
jgi:hypothetical protein